MKKTYSRLWLIALISVLLCPTLSGQEIKGRIVLITHKDEGFKNGFWNALREGAEKAAIKAGYTLDYWGIPVEYQSNRPAGQDILVKKAVAEGFSAILMTPSDKDRNAVSVKYAAINNIPVVSIDSAIESNLLSGVAATNNYAGGLSAAEYMVQLCEGTGGVVMLAHPSRGNKATLDRENSFIDGITRFGPKMKILSSDRFGGATIDTDYQAALQLLRDYPSLKGFYTVSGSGSIGALRAIRDSGKAGKVFLIGWDADKELVAALQTGAVHGIMQQDPEVMATRGIELAVSAINGSPARLRVDIPATLITRKNFNSAEVVRLLAPLGLGGTP